METKYTITEKEITSKNGKQLTFITVNITVAGELMEIGSILKTDEIVKIENLQKKFGE